VQGAGTHNIYICLTYVTWPSRLLLHIYPPVPREVQCSVEGMPLQRQSLSASYHKVNQQMHIICQNHNNVLICQLIHVSGLTGPSSESAHLLKTIIQPFYHLQYAAELS
jgi:hypothetical protein